MGRLGIIATVILMISCGRGTYKRIGEAGDVHVYVIDDEKVFINKNTAKKLVENRDESGRENKKEFKKLTGEEHKELTEEEELEIIIKNKEFLESLEIGDCINTGRGRSVAVADINHNKEEVVIGSGYGYSSLFLSFKDLHSLEKTDCKEYVTLEEKTCYEFYYSGFLKGTEVKGHRYVLEKHKNRSIYAAMNYGNGGAEPTVVDYKYLSKEDFKKIECPDYMKQIVIKMEEIFPGWYD